MALRAKVLQRKAEKLELKKLSAANFNNERIMALEPLLQDVYASRRPKPAEYEVRRDLIRAFNELAKEIYGKSEDIPVVVEFGSFVMDLFSTTSDLDLSVNFRTAAADFPREKKIQTLRKFARKLYAIQSNGHVYGVLPITTAKVPIVKCIDRGTRVECDISVENRDGILKSQLIHIISFIDERFQKLSFLMKIWAKAHNINSSKDKTLNSLSIILLVAFHLQTRKPPVLPPFSAIFKDGIDPTTVSKSISNFLNYGKRNQESVAQLFVTLLIKLSSVENLWQKGLCASTSTASWTSKTWGSKVARISVEDFTDHSQNVSRAVGQSEVKQIYKCISISIQHISSFLSGQAGVELKNLLFGQGLSPAIPGSIMPLSPHSVAASHLVPKLTGKRKKRNMVTHSGTESAREKPLDRPMLLERIPEKKMRASGGWRWNSCTSWGVPAREEACVRTQHTLTCDPTKIQQPMRGCVGAYPRVWGGIEKPSSAGWGARQDLCAEGWEGTQLQDIGEWGTTHQQLPGQGCEGTQQSHAGSWEGTQQPHAGSWGVGTQRPHAGGWGEGTQQRHTGSWDVGTRQPHAGSWGVGTQRPHAGGWGEGTQQRHAGSWDVGTRQRHAGSWGVGTPRPHAGGWGEGTQQRHAGSWDVGTRQRHAGSWGVGTPRPHAGGWGEGTQQRHAGSWGVGTQQRHAGSWDVGTRQPHVGSWGVGTQRPHSGGWGEGTQQPLAWGFGESHQSITCRRPVE